MVAIVTLLVIVFISLLVNRIATVALTFTGLSRDAARFQARSAFTGSGFTTSESELITEHPVRRRIVMMLMFLGNVGLVTVIATLMSGFMNLDRGAKSADLSDYVIQVTDDAGNAIPDLNIVLKKPEVEPDENGLAWRDVLLGVTPRQRAISRMLALLLGVLTLWRLASSKWVDRQLFKVIASMLRQFTRIETYDFQGILHLSEGYTVGEFDVDKDHWTTGRNLMDLRLSAEGIQVLGIMRANKHYIGAPAGLTYIRNGDNLIVYGQSEHIDELMTRKKGHEGEHRHDQRAKDHGAELSNTGAEERMAPRDDTTGPEGRQPAEE